MEFENDFATRDDSLLVTGANGFIGRRIVEALWSRGFRNVRCFVRASSGARSLEGLAERRGYGARLEVFTGNLLSPEDCIAATKGVAVVFHAAAGRGEKSFPDAYLNSVVTTRNLLEGCYRNGCVKRFVNVSSFSVYSNKGKPRRRVLDETAPLENRAELRGEAYCFAKVKQDEIVAECCKRFGISYLIVRPGHVYGPGNEAITGRVGIGTFGLFLHLGGGNPIPLTFVDNCADAIVLAGLRKGLPTGEVVNVVDDDLPSSRQFLRLYKRNVKHFKSVYVPHCLSYVLCCLWERYSAWSQGQLPPVFNARRWWAFWKRTHYSNQKLKTVLGWTQQVPTEEGLRRYFAACRSGGADA